MKTTTIKWHTYIAIFILMLSGTFSAWAEEESIMEGKEKREITRTFSVSMSDQLSIDNRFGDVTVTHWDKKEVLIRVVIQANARTEKRTQELMSYVNVDLNKSGNTVYGTTSMKNFGGTKNNERLRINYFISMPSALKSNVELKYGNIYLPEQTDGVSYLIVKYGNIKAGSFAANLTIESKYGDVNIENVKTANLDLGYCGTVKVGDGQSITVDSKYSNASYGEVKKLVIDDKYGNVTVRMADDAQIDMGYGNLNIGTINSSLITELRYSNLDLKSLAADFKKMNIEASYGNANIRIPSSAVFNVKAANMKYASYSITGFNTRNRKEDSDGVNYYSEVNNGNTKRVIYFEGNKYSNLSVKALP